jgi:hypothetical protein
MIHQWNKALPREAIRPGLKSVSHPGKAPSLEKRACCIEPETQHRLWLLTAESLGFMQKRPEDKKGKETENIT